MRKSIGLLVLVVGLVAESHASVITISGQQWDVSWTQERTFDDVNEDGLLTQQVWWGDFSKAAQFAQVLGYLPDIQRSNANSQIGPLFAHSFYGSGTASVLTKAMSANGSELGHRYFVESQTKVWAYAEPVSPVPLPAAAWLFISAIAGLAGVKRLSGSKASA